MKKHIIKNFDELTVSQLRMDALNILESGYIAIKTEKVIMSQVRVEDNIIYICEEKIDLSKYERIFFVGIGKCAADAGEVFENILGERITDGIVIDVRGVKLDRIKSIVGTHPFPSRANVEAALSIEKMLEDTTENDLIITIVSGGGSALLCLPNEIKCETLVNITKALMKKGADIKEINTVRKHLSLVQGGQFAKSAYPAKIVSLIFSDVPGNDISTIASGPTVMDKTTKKDTEKILAKYDILTICKFPDCDILETPKDEKYFEKVSNILLLTNENALIAMKEKAQELGYLSTIVDTKIQGEAREVGKKIALDGKVGSCLIYGGETTVTVSGNGTGGRNQELVLGALACIKKEEVVVAAASDGWDNSPSAGAIGDIKLFEESKRAGLNINEFLNDNNSYEFFREINGSIKIGRVGSNVSDLYFTLTKK